MVNPTQHTTKGFCQFIGGGDVHIRADAHCCVIVHDKIEEDGGSLPVDEGTAVQLLSVEAKKGNYDLEKH